MKNITITKKLDFDTFVEGMEKGISGSGTSDKFHFTQFGGKKHEFNVSQKLILAYNNYNYAKQILKNQLEEEE